MKLYNLFERRNGKTTLLMTDSLVKVKHRVQQLRAGSRKLKTEFYLEEVGAEVEAVKYKKKPSNHYE